VAVPLSTQLTAGIKRAAGACIRDGRLSVPCLLRVLYEEYGLLDPGEDAPDEDTVLLSTLHSAKGLEARVVYIAHLDDRFIPNRSRDPDEEVRVLYVGMTRAKERLELPFSERYDPDAHRYIRDAGSPFLGFIADHLVVARVTAGDL
jgi:superfamily I DNA/RNA helicase